MTTDITQFMVRPGVISIVTALASRMAAAALSIVVHITFKQVMAA